MNNGYQPKKEGDETPPAPPTSGSNIIPGHVTGRCKFENLDVCCEILVFNDDVREKLLKALFPTKARNKNEKRKFRKD